MPHRTRREVSRCFPVSHPWQQIFRIPPPEVRLLSWMGIHAGHAVDDFRVKIGFLDHPKTVKLRRRIGSVGVECFMRLWEYCSIPGNERTDGNLYGMSDEDIEIASRWEGELNTFVETLVDVGFLDGGPNQRKIHQWREHNSYAAAHKTRSITSQQAIHKRWVKRKKYHRKTEWCDDGCLLTEYDSYTHGIRNTMTQDSPIPHSPFPTTHSPLPVTQSQLPVPVAKTRALAKRKNGELTPDEKASVSRIRHAYVAIYPDNEIAASERKATMAIKRLLRKGHSEEKLLNAIKGNAMDSFAQEKGLTGLAWIMKDGDNVDKFSRIASNGPQPQTRYGKELKAMYQAGIQSGGSMFSDIFPDDEESFK